MGEAIERRHREIKTALIDQPRHLPVEERDQQRRDGVWWVSSDER
jgi:hypothetical protein